jgi:hypothetical protein
MSTPSGHGEGSFIFTRAGVAGGANSDRMRPGADCLLPFFFAGNRLRGVFL